MAVAMLSLRLQFDVAGTVAGLAEPLDRLWRMAGYFTILTNLLVALSMLAVGLRAPINAAWAAGLTLWITMVGIVYHAVLARLWAPVGLAYWADQGLHTAVPLLMAAWWAAFAPKAVTVRHLPLWLIWPLAYCVYALIRGTLTGFWAYPFIDVSMLGWTRVGLNVLGLLAAFAVLGAGLLALSKWLDRSSGAAEQAQRRF